MSRYAGRFPSNRAYAEKALGNRHDIAVKGVGNTKLVRRRDGGIDVTYHGNTIATFHADGTRTYTTAGYATTSTHERLNAMTPPGTGFRTEQRAGKVEIRRKFFTYQADSDVYLLHVATDGDVTLRRVDGEPG